MRSTSRGILKLSIIVFTVVVCVGATAIQAWQVRAPKAESWPAGGGMSSFVPTATPALW